LKRGLELRVILSVLILVFLLFLPLLLCANLGDVEVSRTRNLQYFEMTPSVHPPGDAYVSRLRNLQYFERLTTSNDIYVVSIEPIQVVLDAKALIMNKETVVRVNINSSFSERKWVNINVTYDFGTKSYLETGPNGNGVPIDPGNNWVYIPGGPAKPAHPETEDWELEGFLTWTRTGIDNMIKVTITPLPDELNSNNNEMTLTPGKKVAESKPFRILVVPVYFPDIGQTPFTPRKTWLERQEEYLRSTFPVADEHFLWHDHLSPIPISGTPPLPPLPIILDSWLYWYVARDMSALARISGYDRVVIVIQDLTPGWAGNAIGMWIHDRVPVIVLDESIWQENLVAHELGHTYYLCHPNDLGPPVFDAKRFWVAERDYERDAITFMNATLPLFSWIDKGRYDNDPLVEIIPGVLLRWNLFDQLAIIADPEVMLLRFIVFENDTAVADKPWYLSMGIPDLVLGTTGNYSIVLLDDQSQLISQMGFNASFTYFQEVNGTMVEAQTDTLPFIFTIPYVNGTSVIQIRNATDHILLSKSISSNSPTVNVTFPNGGEALTAGIDYTISWNGSDVDEDNLAYTLAYSEDGGENWVPLAIDLNQTSYIWDTTFLQKGSNYLVKVIATDGVNTSEDVSDNAFTVKVHDIATTKVTSSKAVVGQGYNLYINVTITNEGNFTETFNVTVYANTTEIETREITLSDGNSTIIMFTWVSTGVPYGNYTLKAVADTVPGEVDTDDNTHVDSTVYVGIPGDINADGIVDIFDALTLAGAFGSEPGYPNWNPDADLVVDEIIDIFDALALAGNYGETV